MAMPSYTRAVTSYKRVVTSYKKNVPGLYAVALKPICHVLRGHEHRSPGAAPLTVTVSDVIVARLVTS